MKSNNSGTGNKSLSDLIDAAEDLAEMKSEPVTIDLPDVKDIPGQENIVPASPGELADMTIASDDEEGDSIFADNTDNIDDEIEESKESKDANVSSSEKNDLETAANDMPTDDDINLRKAALDDTDDEGILLNEESFKKNVTGSDLDIPGSEDDDVDEEIGEEDEENNAYSLGGDNHDEIPEDSF
jgi:hypothetical protein